MRYFRCFTIHRLLLQQLKFDFHVTIVEPPLTADFLRIEQILFLFEFSSRNAEKSAGIGCSGPVTTVGKADRAAFPGINFFLYKRILVKAMEADISDESRLFKEVDSRNVVILYDGMALSW